MKNFLRGKTLRERKKFYRLHVAAEIMYSTGARINEISVLTKNDIDLTRSVITINDTKNKKRRDLILNSYARELLYHYLEVRDTISSKEEKRFASRGHQNRRKIQNAGTPRLFPRRMHYRTPCENRRLGLHRQPNSGSLSRPASEPH